MVERRVAFDRRTMVASSVSRHAGYGPRTRNPRAALNVDSCRTRSDAVQPRSLEQRVTMLEEQMQEIRGLPARVAGVELQIVQLREEMRESFSATRSELRGEMHGIRDELRAEMRGVRDDLRVEIRAGDQETRDFMRMLYEEL